MKPTPRVKRFFSPLVIVYCVAVVLVVLFIAYIAFSKTVITVTIKPVPDHAEFSYPASVLDGEERSQNFEHEFSFTEYDATEEPGTARGTVTIVNTYSVDQPLIETTRLLSQEGVLFRTDETVTVPAGGEVEVPVYADQTGASGNIGSTKFEIVALWDGLKDNIYAVSDTAMTGGVIKRVTMTEELAQQAKLEAEAAAETYAQELVGVTTQPALIDDVTQTVAPAIGETGDAIMVKTTGRVATITYEDEALLKKLQTDVQADLELNAVTVLVQRTAADALMLSGTVTLPNSEPSTDFIDTSTLTNKTSQQVTEAILAYEQVRDVAVALSPAWATRTPALEQQIQLQFIVAEE